MMRTIKGLIFVLMAVIMSASPLYSTIYGSVSGVVTDEDTGKAVPKVLIHLFGPTRATVVTDKDGKFLVNQLEPGKYSIDYIPSFPHCNISIPEPFILEPGKHMQLNLPVKLGGVILGRVIHRESQKPFPGVRIRAYGRRSGVENKVTKEDGRYFLGDLGRLCPSPHYYITADCKVPNVAYKVLLGVNVEKGIETEAEDIIFDLNDPTGIEGYITSSIDGKPLNDVQISILSLDKEYPGLIPSDKNRDVEMGVVTTNVDGYYYVKNLEPGNYWIFILPPIEDDWGPYETKEYCKKKYGIVVTSGKKTRVDSKLDVRATSNSSDED